MKLTHENEVIERIKQSPEFIKLRSDIRSLLDLVETSNCENGAEVSFCCRNIERLHDEQLELLKPDSTLYKRISIEIDERAIINRG